MTPSAASSRRAPAVAGAFYPASAAQLRAEVTAHLSAARPGGGSPRALVVPHAGYLYSGPIAGTAYAALAQLTPRPRRVVLLGPAHRVAFEGLALPDAEVLDTPLGAVAVDAEGAATARAFPQVQDSARVHRDEHSLEVQLPFLQVVLPGVPVVPLVVGRASPEAVAEVVEALWDEQTVVLVSSDLSHFHTAEVARSLDARTCEAIVALKGDALDGDAACGAAPLKGLLHCARARGLKASLLDLRNSSDTAGDPGRVVGYAAIAFEAPA